MSALMERLSLSVRAAKLGAKIRVDAVFPPIPTRDSDYAAIDESSYDAEYFGEEDGWRGGPIGYGPTEEAAIEALLDILEEDAP